MSSAVRLARAWMALDTSAIRGSVASQRRALASPAPLSDAWDQGRPLARRGRWAACALAAVLALLFGAGEAQARDWTKPTLTGAAVMNRTLTLTYNEALNEASVPGPYMFQVTVAGKSRAVAGVAVSGRAVTLSLVSAVLRDQTVTVSYATGWYITVAMIRDLARNTAGPLWNRAVTNTTANVSGPAYTGPSLAPLDGIPDTQASYSVPSSHFSAGGETLTFSVSANRSDVFVSGSLRYANGTVWFQPKKSCALANLTPPATSPLRIVITLTASDPDGATAHVKRTLNVSFLCPALTDAAVTDKTLTLTYGSLPAGFAPAADEFTVKVDGNAVALATTNPVSVSDSTVTLTLAAPVGANQAVTVSHSPGADPKTARFTDRAVRVTSTNSAPTYDGPAINLGVFPHAPVEAPYSSVYVNSPPGVNMPAAAFSDPDGDALTFSVRANRGRDVVTATGAGSTVYVHVRAACALRNVTPTLPARFETVVTVTATDPPAQPRG